MYSLSSRRRPKKMPILFFSTLAVFHPFSRFCPPPCIFEYKGWRFSVSPPLFFWRILQQTPSTTLDFFLSLRVMTDRQAKKKMRLIARERRKITAVNRKKKDESLAKEVMITCQILALFWILLSRQHKHI